MKFKQFLKEEECTGKKDTYCQLKTKMGKKIHDELRAIFEKTLIESEIQNLQENWAHDKMKIAMKKIWDTLKKPGIDVKDIPAYIAGLDMSTIISVIGAKNELIPYFDNLSMGTKMQLARSVFLGDRSYD